MIPEFARALANAIQERSDRHADALDIAEQQGQLRALEPGLLYDLESSVLRAQDRYRPSLAQGRETARLVFQDLYDQAFEQLDDFSRTALKAVELRPALIAALFAAQVEAFGPLRLANNQVARIVDVLSRLGTSLRADGLFLHAARAFDRAARLCLEIDDYQTRDICLFNAANCRHRALPRSARRSIQSMSAALVGYGMRPYRLLGWIGAQLAVACTILLLLPRRASQPPLEMLYIGLQDFIGMFPVGVGDTESLSHAAWIVLTVESYLGSISVSVFFALLIRRWFRV